MFKFLLCLLFTSSLQAAPQIEEFVYRDHFYLYIDEKIVIHDPDCPTCYETSYFFFDPHQPGKYYKMIQEKMRKCDWPLSEDYS